MTTLLFSIAFITSLIFLLFCISFFWIRFNREIIDSFIVKENDFAKIINLKRNYSKIIVSVEHADGNYDTFDCVISLSNNGKIEKLAFESEPDGHPPLYDLITDRDEFTKKGSFEFKLSKWKDYPLKVDIIGKKY